MESLLALPKVLEMSEKEKAEINRLIESTVAAYKNNAAMIYKLTFDTLTALTASDERLQDLEQKGFFNKFLTQLAGPNQEMNFPFETRHIQYAAQKLMQMFAEQKLLTFDLVTAVNNKLDTMIVEKGEEINRVYEMLGAFFKQTRSDLIQLEARLEKIERNVGLLHWNATIEYQMYDGTEYGMLEDNEKIVCITNDFFHRTKGEWTTSDLMLLKSALGEIGLSTKKLISSESFYASLIEKPELIDRLLAGIYLEGLLTIEPYEAPLIKGVEKAQKIHTDEKYILETVKIQLDIAKVVYSDREVQLSLIHQFLKNMAYSNPDHKVNLFDFVMELLVNLKMVNESGKKVQEEEEANLKENNCEVILLSYGEDKYRFIEGLQTMFSIKREEAKKLAEHLPATILSKVTKETAEKAVSHLSSLGARARVKTDIETYYEVLAPMDGKIYLTDENPYQILSLINNVSKSFVKAGDPVDEGTVVAIIYKSPSMMFGLEDPFVRAGMKGNILEVIVHHKQEVKKGDLIMIIRAED